MPFALPGQSILTVGGRRVVVGDPISAAKTYEDFVAHITTRAATLSPASQNVSAGTFRFVSDLSSTLLYGTSWGPLDSNTGWTGQLGGGAAHGFPSQSIRLASAGQQILLVIGYITTRSSFASYTRNGITSAEIFEENEAFVIGEQVWWDDVQKKAFSNNPSIGSAPVEYPF